MIKNLLFISNIIVAMLGTALIAGCVSAGRYPLAAINGVIVAANLCMAWRNWPWMFDDDNDAYPEGRGCFSLIIACLIFWAVVGTACSKLL